MAKVKIFIRRTKPWFYWEPQSPHRLLSAEEELWTGSFTKKHFFMLHTLHRYEQQEVPICIGGHFTEP